MAETITSDSRNALTKALEILDVMLSDSAPQSVLDIGRQLSLPRQTTHRLVDQLEQAGLVTRQIGRKAGFVIGPRLASLSVTSLRQIWQNGPVLAVLQQISQRLQTACAVAILDRDAVVFIHSVYPEEHPCDSMQTLMTSLITTRYPVHTMAAGKLLAAYRSPRVRKRIAFGIVHPRHTRSTITDGSALQAEFDVIERRGYALSCEEHQAGLSDVAVPVRNPDDEVVVALCALGTSDICSAHDLERQRDVLYDGVARIEQQISFS